MEVLLKRGWNINKSFPVHIAAQNGKEEMVEYLIKRGMNVDEKHEGKLIQRPLRFASAEGHLEVVKLLNNGADSNSEDGNARPPIVEAINNGHVKVVKEFIAHGASLGEYGSFGLLLHYIWLFHKKTLKLRLFLLLLVLMSLQWMLFMVRFLMLHVEQA